MKLPAKGSGDRKSTAAKSKDFGDCRLHELIDAVSKSLKRYLSEEWEQMLEGLGEIREMLVEAENRIGATGIVTERDQHLIVVCRPMLERLLKINPPLRTPEEIWERSGHTNTEALLAMLRPFETSLPPTLLKGLTERLRRPWSMHELRWALVYVGNFVEKLSWPEAYKNASERLTGTSAGASPYSMKYSYQLQNRLFRAGVRRDLAKTGLKTRP